jgi:hypothetical protein
LEQAQPAPHDLGKDLQFVRSAVERNRGDHEGPMAVYWLWGAVTLIGFSLSDFAPQASGRYWALMGPLAGVATWLIMRRIMRRYGIADRKESVREWMQWIGMAAVIVLLSLDVGAGKFNGATLGQLIMLVVGYTYFLTYVRRGDVVMLVGGLAMVFGFVLLAYQQRYVWTTIGACVFVALAGGSTIAHLTRKRSHG